MASVKIWCFHWCSRDNSRHWGIVILFASDRYFTHVFSSLRNINRVFEKQNGLDPEIQDGMRAVPEDQNGADRSLSSMKVNLISSYLTSAPFLLNPYTNSEFGLCNWVGYIEAEHRRELKGGSPVVERVLHQRGALSCELHATHQHQSRNQ